MERQEKISKKVIGAIVATGLMSFCGVLVETAMNITFPTLMKEFSIETATVQWMTTIYLLAVAIVVPLSANFKKSFKMKHLFLTANLLFIIGVVIDILSPLFSLLLIGRVIQGIGTGIALPLMFNIILEQVPRSKLGTMMGVGTLITAAAPAIGPTFGGIIVSFLGWRYVFIFLLPVLVLSLVLGFFCVEQKSAVQYEAIDFLSFLCIIFTFTGFILGFSNMGSKNFFSLLVAGAFVLGILGLIGLVWRSNRIQTPIIDLTVLKNTKYAGHAVGFLFFQLISLGLAFLLPNYIQLVNGDTATTAALIVFPGAALGAVMSPFGGRILDSLGARKPILIGSLISAMALLGYTFLNLEQNNLLIGVIYVIYMVGLALAFGNIMTNGLSHLTLAQRSDGNAVITTLQQFAGAVGTSIVAAIVGVYQTNTTLSYRAGTAQGTKMAFGILLIIGILQIIVLIQSTAKIKTNK